MAVLKVVACLVVASLLNGVILKLLWGWFVVPFSNVPVPGIPLVLAIGYGFLISLLLLREKAGWNENQGEGFITGIKLTDPSLAIVAPVSAVVLGWIVHLHLFI